MESFKVAFLASAMTLSGVALGAYLFGGNPVQAQQAGFRECFFGRQESVDINNDGIVDRPGRNRMIVVPPGFEVVSGGGASTISNGNANDASILLCRR